MQLPSLRRRRRSGRSCSPMAISVEVSSPWPTDLVTRWNMTTSTLRSAALQRGCWTPQLSAGRLLCRHAADRGHPRSGSEPEQGGRLVRRSCANPVAARKAPHLVPPSSRDMRCGPFGKRTYVRNRPRTPRHYWMVRVTTDWTNDPAQPGRAATRCDSLDGSGFLLIRRFWVRIPGGAPRSGWSEGYAGDDDSSAGAYLGVNDSARL